MKTDRFLAWRGITDYRKEVTRYAIWRQNRSFWIKNLGHQPGLIPQFLQQRGVECIVAGGMGMRAQGFFAEAGIQTILGASGRIDGVIEKLQRGTLESGESLCKPGSGKRYGLDRAVCDHPHGEHDKCEHKNKHEYRWSYENLYKFAG